MERSSFEVPFPPVLFCVAQAPSEGPSCGQEVLSDVPLSGQSKQCLCLNHQLSWGAGATQLLSTLPVSLAVSSFLFDVLLPGLSCAAVRVWLWDNASPLCSLQQCPA